MPAPPTITVRTNFLRFIELASHVVGLVVGVPYALKMRLRSANREIASFVAAQRWKDLCRLLLWATYRMLTSV